MPCDTSKGMERENRETVFSEKKEMRETKQIKKGFMLYLFDVNWYFGYNKQT